MAFRRALLALVLAGCGDSAHDLTFGGDPVLVIRARVDLARLARTSPTSQLWGALYWTDRSEGAPVPQCKALEKSTFQAYCPDPDGAALQHPPVRTAPVDANGDFDLPIFARPPIDRLDKNDAQTSGVVHGTLLVIEDVAGRGPPVGSLGGFSRERSYVILAASFHSTAAAQQRIVYREGDSSHPPFEIFPAGGCPHPGDGFSLLSAGPGGVPCMVSALGATSPRIEVPPVTAREAQGLTCRREEEPGVMITVPDAFDPGRTMPGANDQVTCVPPDLVIASSPDAYCLLPYLYLLRCNGGPLCRRGNWDYTANPPPWWRQACMQ